MADQLRDSTLRAQAPAHPTQFRRLTFDLKVQQPRGFPGIYGLEGAQILGFEDSVSVKIIIGDVRDKLLELPDESVHCVVTSPPYFGLRSYDENSLVIDSRLPAERREWLEQELMARGIYAKR